MTGQSILLIGGTGFIGRALARRLDSAGVELTIVRRRGRSSSVRLPGREISLDHLDPNTIRSALQGAEFDRVFNLAAYGVSPHDRDLEQMLRINVGCPAALVETVRAKRSFIHVGSCSEYAASMDTGRIGEDSPLESFKLYGASKAAGSIIASAVARANEQSFAVARLFNVFGPGEAEYRLLPSLMTRLSAGVRVPLSPGTQVRDFLSVSDVVEALIELGEAIEESRQQKIVNLCSGAGISVRTFAETLCRAVGGDPSLLGFGDLPFRPDDVPSIVGNPSEFFNLTSWRPHYSLDERLIQVVAEASFSAEASS